MLIDDGHKTKKEAEKPPRFADAYSSAFLSFCFGFFFFRQALSLRTNAQSLGL
jgi:hypothetical protein